MLEEVREEQIIMNNSEYLVKENINAKSAEGKKRKRNNQSGIKIASAVFKTPAREETYLYKVRI